MGRDRSAHDHTWNAVVLDQVPPAAPRSGFVTEKEFGKISARLPEHLRVYFSFLFLSGWRSGRASRLTWAEVDRERGEIRLEGAAPKNKGTGRVLPYHADPRIKRLIDEQWERTKALQAERGQIIPLVFWKPTRIGPVRINGAGSLGHATVFKWAQQPLALELQVSVRGVQADNLRVLGLLKPEADSLGYLPLIEKLSLDGTIANVGANSLLQLIQQKPAP